MANPTCTVRPTPAIRKNLCWYINIQEPVRRTAIGYDTQDLELDLVVYPDGQWELEDDELMDQRVLEGRWTGERVANIRVIGAEFADRLEKGERWWTLKWRDWISDLTFAVPNNLPDEWAAV